MQLLLHFKRELLKILHTGLLQDEELHIVTAFSYLVLIDNIFVNSFPLISVSGRLPRISTEAPLDVSISFPHKRLWTLCLHFRISASRRPSIISAYRNEVVPSFWTGNPIMKELSLDNRGKPKLRQKLECSLFYE